MHLFSIRIVEATLAQLAAEGNDLKFIVHQEIGEQSTTSNSNTSTILIML